MAILAHLFPMHPLFTSRKHQKTLRVSDVFRGQRKGTLGTNGLKLLSNQQALNHSNWFLHFELVSSPVMNLPISSQCYVFIPPSPFPSSSRTKRGNKLKLLFSHFFVVEDREVLTFSDVQRIEI